MANVNIYAEHREMLDALITSSKVSSVAGAVKTGPFRDQRDAYVFAASIAMALDIPCHTEEMPTSRKGAASIRDSVFLGADGAKEIAIAVALVTSKDTPTTRESLSNQLDLMSDEMLDERFTLLDKFAYAGFEWLTERQKDETNIRDLVLGALEEIECAKVDNDNTVINDPLIDLLGDMQL